MNPKSIHEEEIDLIHFLKAIKRFYIGVLKLIFSAIIFFKKKIVLFFTLLIIGIFLGYFLDEFFSKEKYHQEIIIQPNYDSALYIYDFIENLNTNIYNNNFIESLGIKQHEITGLIGVEIAPIIRQTDILDYFKNIYDEKDVHHVIENIKLEALEDKKYRKFYKFHKVTFNFEDNNEESKKLSEIVLKLLKLNPYFKTLVSFETEKTKKEIAQTKETLDFVNKYLKNINDKKLEIPKPDKDILIYSNDDETHTIASLLEQKSTLIDKINEQERILALRFDVFNILEYQQVLKKEKGLRDYKMIVLPIFLVCIVSFYFLIIFLNKKMKSLI